MRDYEMFPYSEEEQRVSDYIQDITEGLVGSGDDPIGFLLASHMMISYQLRQLEKANSRRKEEGYLPSEFFPEQKEI